MHVDFEKIISDRIAVLEKRIENIRNLWSELLLSDGIEFRISDIQDIATMSTYKAKVGVPQLEFLGAIEGPVVYFFELTGSISKVELLPKFENYKRGEKENSKGKAPGRSIAKFQKGW